MSYTEHQFSLFAFNEIRPTTKVPISKERIEEAKRLMFSKPKDAAAALREVRESLERYEQRINGTQIKNPQTGRSGDGED